MHGAAECDCMMDCIEVMVLCLLVVVDAFLVLSAALRRWF